MKRYFEIVGQRQVVELNILDGSQAATAPAEVFSKTFKCEMRELNKAEYDRLAMTWLHRICTSKNNYMEV